MIVSVVIIAALGFYDVWRGDTGAMMSQRGGEPVRVRHPSPSLFLFYGSRLLHRAFVCCCLPRRTIASEVAAGVARVVRVSARLAALALLPIVAIAIYSFGLRVNDYGWTNDRMIAAACLLVASCYAIGYAWAVFRKTAWMRVIAPTNVLTAYMVLAVLVALFSPIADPARVSVNNQVARLQAGLVGVASFDFEYLKFEGGRYGKAALDQLANQAHGTDAASIRDKTQRVLALGP